MEWGSLSAAEAADAAARLSTETRFATVFEEYERARTAVEACRTNILPRVEQAYEPYLTGTARWPPPVRRCW